MDLPTGITGFVAWAAEWVIAHAFEIVAGVLLGINAWWTKRQKKAITENREEIVETKRIVKDISAEFGSKAATVAAAAQRAVEAAAMDAQGIKDDIRGITLQINGRVDELLRLARELGYRDGYAEGKKELKEQSS